MSQMAFVTVYLFITSDVLSLLCMIRCIIITAVMLCVVFYRSEETPHRPHIYKLYNINALSIYSCAYPLILSQPV